ncbi:MAG: serine/threonine-protein phosphatase [Okeania sp. SIO2G4]|uniref:PP2C family protein-serine/threonine phosphatase n=1 Tax=unclassified Okeania TaxID=2634635 RepID=UPI0013BADB6B|nr:MULTISPECIES: PP2C family serine/threonine-protein phosphatase [unclassified Okeania]NEP74658.1 serine/threonine-protein phosphatase [Okeania sp. SIO2G5]NEP95719.1 serine/threonine-protein phosphatase [Okeania sp. SIO2F5]NEQ93518.1 serine/threonine-protein phosphatase [Okeania sp. SIO2G4]
MSSTPLIHCPNINCPHPANSWGRQECEACQTQLIYRYLWAVDAGVEIPVGEFLGDRYYVVAPQVWLDTKPAQPPFMYEELPDNITPYLYLYPYKLHTPGVYGFYQYGEEAYPRDILLLDNVPLDSQGQLYPAFVEAWPTATPVRQVYWLWQIMQLWKPLSKERMAFSLLTNSLRVEGWRLRLLELDLQNRNTKHRDLRIFWSNLIPTAHTHIQQPLQEICQMIGDIGESLEAIAPKLNQLLLEQAAKLPLSAEIVGATDTGPVRLHNEDCCYPTEQDLASKQLVPHLAMICDGVGGHDGGEVASQLAVQSIKRLVQNLLTEVAQQQDLTSPDLVMKQLEEIIRVVNNMIATENDEQGRESRQRMGTTLVMALQLPQQVKPSLESNPNNAHELYIANLGDSRAYWLTKNACQLLTVDDDVASREVCLGHCLYWQALQRRDAGALTQALGTRDGEFICPTIQRFLIEEEGLLLLCSDGLSDNDWVEKSWTEYTPRIFRGEFSLKQAVEYLIELANQKNGHDNTSVVLAHYRISPEQLILLNNPTARPLEREVMPELSEASKALLYSDDDEVSELKPEADLKSGPDSEVEAMPKSPRLKPWMFMVGLLLILSVGAFVAVWRNWENFRSNPNDAPTSSESPMIPEPSEAPVSPDS